MTRRVLASVVAVATIGSTIVVSTRVLAAGDPPAFPTMQRVVATPQPTPTPPPPMPDPTAEPTPEPTPVPVPVATPRPVTTPPPTVRPEPVRAAGGGRGNYTALLIGISYAPGHDSIPGSMTDVRNMRDALLARGYKRSNVITLTDERATREAILSALDSFVARTSGKGTAVFLLATHSGRSGGDLTFATAGGGRISRHELADKLGRVPGKLWSMLPTCYSKGYAIPGVVGKDRIAVFSSKSDEFSWQLGSAGSWLVLYMIDYGLLRGQSSATTVEDAFAWTKQKLVIDAPKRAPILSDGVRGELPLAAR